ncbi:hypothetical protein M885DRAFT_116376 [Pelagophyceae sp. CCMP2097]|nr:hypothetical protein M885DRAFT_116376 [Pelagophyceae sp. CCMP2097]|mmetsp:Transcript_31723/g.106879  ORF Transcript_31723/g.106879 Transcript_31723/m.106879 type:complete len:417 (-) Transcript_31723:106-1356(-)
MTEYWVSKAKHFCNYCKCWTQGDSTSIKRHEEGKGHKERVAHYLAARRKNKQTQPGDADVRKQLEEIEHAAAARMAETSKNPMFASSAAAYASHAPAGSRRSATTYPGMPGLNDNRALGSSAPAQQEDEKEEEEETGPGDDDNGEYEIRGVRYYQGQRHFEKFRSGGKCEMWIEARDEWVAATIAKVRRYAKGDGDESRKYDVRLAPVEVPKTKPDGTPLSRLEQHMTKQFEEGQLLEDVKIKDLRVQADEDGVWRPPRQSRQGADGSVAAASSAADIAPVVKEEVKIDAHTGLGQWQTVSVREYDEEEEQIAEAARAAQYSAKVAARDERSRRKDNAVMDRLHEMTAAQESRDAMNSQLRLNDRTDSYRGVKLADDDDPVEDAKVPAKEAGAVADGAAPVFKKRKITSKFRKVAS